MISQNSQILQNLSFENWEGVDTLFQNVEVHVWVACQGGIYNGLLLIFRHTYQSCTTPLVDYNPDTLWHENFVVFFILFLQVFAGKTNLWNSCHFNFALGWKFLFQCFYVKYRIFIVFFQYCFFFQNSTWIFFLGFSLDLLFLIGIDPRI